MECGCIKLVIDSTNYVKFDQIATATGLAIDSYDSVTAKLLNPTGRTLITNSNITMTAVSGEDDSYEGEFPSTCDFASLEEVIVQITISATVDGASGKVLVHEETVTPTRK